MNLYEPVTLTYVLISVLILVLSGELFDVFLTRHERDCHRRNTVLLERGALGPLQACE